MNNKHDDTSHDPEMDEKLLSSSSTSVSSEMITVRVKTTNDSSVLDIEVNKNTDLVIDLKRKVSNALSAYGKNIRLISSGIYYISFVCFDLLYISFKFKFIKLKGSYLIHKTPNYHHLTIFRMALIFML